MGILHFLDSRRGIARWAATWFNTCRRMDPTLSDQDIIELALRNRYQIRALTSRERPFYQAHRHEVNDIYQLCVFVFSVETSQDPADIRNAIRVMFDELKKKGF